MPLKRTYLKCRKSLKRTGFKRPGKAKSPESTIQSLTEMRLNLAGIYYLRIPDTLYRLLSWQDNRLRLWEKKALKDALAGLPDCNCAIPVGGYYLGLPIECKSDKGKLRARQKAYHNKIPVTVIREDEELTKAIKEYQNKALMVDRFLRMLDGYMEESDFWDTVKEFKKEVK